MAKTKIQPADPQHQERQAVTAQIFIAAGVMLQTLDRRGRNPWPKDVIVDPRLRGRSTAGRYRKPGLDLAVDAVARVAAVEGLPINAAAHTVARRMVNVWLRSARRSDDLQRLTGVLPSRGSESLADALRPDMSPVVRRSVTTKWIADTLSDQLRRTYYRRRTPR